MSLFISASCESMDVAFCRKAFRRGRQLHVVRAARDDPLARLDARLDTDEAAVACGHLDETARETLASDVHEDIGPARFHQHGIPGYSWYALMTTGVEDGCSRLANKQLAIRILHFHLDWECLAHGIEHTRIVDVIKC